MPDDVNRAAEEILQNIDRLCGLKTVCSTCCIHCEKRCLPEIAAIIERCIRESESGVSLINRERQRQIYVERFDAEHDDNRHMANALAWAAAYYAVPGSFVVWDGQLPVGVSPDEFFARTKWDNYWAKRDSKTRIQQLTAAGALIAAEIDRLRRREADHA